MRNYLDNRWHGVALGPNDFVQLPTAVAVFTNHFVPEGDPPREWAERLFNLHRWTPMPSGGDAMAAGRSRWARCCRRPARPRLTP